jgi:sodium/potassium/calcium exchanger 6
LISGRVPLIAVAEAITIGLWLLLIIICRNKPPRYMWIFQIYSFIIIIVWISYVCSILINLLELFQVVTSINSVFLGLTLLAFGNSIGGKNFLKQIIFQ